MAQDKPATANKLMQEAMKQLTLAQSRVQILDVSNRWWARFVEASTDDKTIAAWDAAVLERIQNLQKLTGEQFALPKIEEGYYMGPTPPVGYRVQWYQCNDPNIVFGADVVAIEGPGKLQLRIIKAKNAATTFGDFVMGCLHVSDPIHERRHNVNTQTGGSWGYLPGEKIPDSHYATARAETQRRRRNREQAAEQRRLRDASIKAEEEAAKALT